MVLPDPPPPATTNTSACVVPAGTAKVPDDVKPEYAGILLVNENALELVFEAASTALTTKLNTVVSDVVPSVPAIIAVPPSAAVFVIE